VMVHKVPSTPDLKTCSLMRNIHASRPTAATKYPENLLKGRCEFGIRHTL